MSSTRYGPDGVLHHDSAYNESTDREPAPQSFEAWVTASIRQLLRGAL